MKAALCTTVFIILNTAAVYCGGLVETEPVNEHRISLEQVNRIEIAYRSEEIALFTGTDDCLVIKEYMSENNSDYYARVSKTPDRLLVERGRRPLRLFNIFYACVEVYLPVSYRNGISLQSTSGSITGPDEYVCSNMAVKSSSGSISFNSVTADTVYFKTSSGSIRSEKIQGAARFQTSSGEIVSGGIAGDVSAETSSGRIKLNSVTGTVTAKTSSGAINCTVTETVNDISLVSSSGSVSLNVPKDISFRFSTRSSSGNLSTPFTERLVSPVSDRRFIQGTITAGGVPESEISRNITIKTTSGSVRVKWTD
jgi:hypothetical protein